jgi:hypothetical protein
LVTVDRDTATWTTTGDTTVNDIDIAFPQCTGGTNTITHASLTRQGSTVIIASGALTVPLSVSNTIRPQIDAGNWSLTFA